MRVKPISHGVVRRSRGLPPLTRAIHATVQPLEDRRLFAAAPANDLFSDSIVLSGTDVTATGTNVGATKEAGEPSHAGSAGGASVWWSWTAPSFGSVKIDTAGSSFD